MPHRPVSGDSGGARSSCGAATPSKPCLPHTVVNARPAHGARGLAVPRAEWSAIASIGIGVTHGVAVPPVWGWKAPTWGCRAWRLPKHCTPQRGTRRIVRLPWSPHRMVVGPSASLRRFRFPTFSAPRVAIGERARPLARVLGPEPSRRGKWIGYRRRNRRPCALYWIHRPLPLARPVQPSIGGPDSATI